MAAGRVSTETAEYDRDQGAAATPARPGRAERSHRVAPGRVATGIANYDRIAVRPVARV